MDALAAGRAAGADFDRALERLRRVFDDPDAGRRAADGIRRLAAFVPITAEALEDAPTLRIGILLVLAGFGVKRCSECGRRLRCVWTRPHPVSGWSAPLLLGSTCYRKVGHA